MSILLFTPDTAVRGRGTDTAQSMDNVYWKYNDYHAELLILIFGSVFTSLVDEWQK